MTELANPAEAFGILVCHQLNMLHQEPCCDRCCAPCGVIRALAAADELDAAVMSAPLHLWTDVDWWVGGTVDRDWLASRLGCQSVPACGDDRG